MRFMSVFAVTVSLLWCAQPAASAEPLPDIRVHAIVEAPVSQVWSMLTSRFAVEKWLCEKASHWQPEKDGRFAITLPRDDEMRGRITSIEPEKRITLAWPTPATELTFEITKVDHYLTMLSVIQTGFPAAAPRTPQRHEKLEDRWRLALIRFHQQFREPIVDPRYTRPRVEGAYVDRNLLINGSFERVEGAMHEGIAFGWEPNSPPSKPDVHAVDDKIARVFARSQRIAHPPDWTNYAVQQFTSDLMPLIVPGKRYRLTGWIRAEGISNPAGWYKLGLWATDLAGRPIGEPMRNAILRKDDGAARLNHGWHHFTIEMTAPPNSSRAVVVLTGHWDEDGTVWYDDLRLWEVGPPATTTHMEPAPAPEPAAERDDSPQ